jgi:ubiquinone biosynthesis monooxygenase Coq7
MQASAEPGPPAAPEKERANAYNRQMARRYDLQDGLVALFDRALRAAAPPPPGRPSPARGIPEPSLTAAERRQSAALMRVNHAGEVSAQALYLGQSILARSAETREQLLRAAREERDHLDWCAERLTELSGRTSLLGPGWYTGSFLIGLAAGALGDRASLGFVAETERQVEAHLQDHLQRLPATDVKSGAILRRMSADEIHHATTARLAGGTAMPKPIPSIMRFGGGVLRTAALWV